MLDILEEKDLKTAVVNSLCSKISEHISHRTGENLKFGVMLFSEKYGFLGQTENTENILLRWK
jgi:cobalt-precorrin-5B (C1)-methyltransferase